MDWFDPIRGLFDVDWIRRSVHALVVGGGRVGWELIRMMVYHGVRRISLIEPDWNERRNYASGVGEAGMGLPKIRATKDELYRLSPRIAFRGAAERLSVEHPGIFLEWMRDATHIVLAIGDFPVAAHLGAIAYAERPCIYATVLENGRSGEAAWSWPRRTPCVGCTGQLSEKRGAEGGQTMLVDVAEVVHVAFKEFMGLSLAGRRGFERFAHYVDPHFCLAMIINAPDATGNVGRPDIPSLVRLVQVVDEQGDGPSCSVCRGYRP
ncbi:MAG: hypothetical protein FJ288_02235 [Planctomycetes bacterium]|nr:hypothetical protein [Planctomycetota bacterium]